MRPSSLQPFWTFLGASAVLHLALVAELPGVPLRIDAAPAPLSAEIVALTPAPAPAPNSSPLSSATTEAATQPIRTPPADSPKRAAKAAAAAKPPPPPPAPPRALPPAPPRASPPAKPAEPVASIPAAEVPEVPAEALSEAPHEGAQPAADSPSEQTTGVQPEPAAPTSAQDGAERTDVLATAATGVGSPAAASGPVMKAPMKAPPAQTGTIQFEVFYGSDRFSIGRSVQTWEIDQDSYRLTSFSETTGLAALFKPYQYSYVTEGHVGPDGLRPDAFTVSRGRTGEKQASARFDWANGELTFGKLGSPRKATLGPNSYDLLTLFYELPRIALNPGRIEVSVTTGSKFKTYLLEVLPEELIQLPIGTVRAVPVRQVREPGEESIAVWLAPEKHNLPVRICFFDEDGAMSVEQVATRISVGTLAADGR